METLAEEVRSLEADIGDLKAKKIELAGAEPVAEGEVQLLDLKKLNA